MVDYDTTVIPKTYDAGREISTDKKKTVMRFFAERIPAEQMARIIDLGCGTGRFSRMLADLFEAEVLGVEPSEMMLEQARIKHGDERFSFALGSGEEIPADEASADMIFMSMVYHHLEDKPRVARECNRVLQKGGRVCIRNTVFDEIDSYVYHPFFPSIRDIIGGRLVSRSTMTGYFEQAGFRLAANQTVPEEISPDWKTYAEKMKLRADSFVASLPDEEFNSGLVKLQAHAETQEQGRSVKLNIDYFVFQKDT